jgi:GNAT superfamily N-acetyltransferase
LSSITFTTHSESQPAQRELLAEILWGSPGGLRYQLLDGTAWDRLPASTEMLLAHRGEEVVGCYVLAPQSWGTLRLLLAVRSGAQGSGVGRALVEHVARLKADDVLAGTIESSNERSLRISLDAGYQQVAELEVRSFTRQRPELQPGLRIAREDEIPRIAEYLRAQDHEWFDAAQLRASELLVGPDLSFGMQFCIHTWKLTNLGLPRGVDALARKALPTLGIRPDHFHFATGHFWWGDPSRWQSVLEHALFFWKLQAIVLTGDVRSNLWKDLRQNVSFGLVGTAMGGDGMVVTSNRPLNKPIHFTPLNAV